MKNLRIHAVCVCMSLMSFCSYAQNDIKPLLNEPDYNKPRLFANLPQKIEVNMDAVTNLFNKAIGASVDLDLSSKTQFRFDGVVVSTASNHNDKLQSVVIRSSSFNGAGLTISKIVEEDGSITFRGRIVNLKSSDLFELQKLTDGYFLVKRNFYDLINE